MHQRLTAGSTRTSRLVTDSPPIAIALRQPDEPNPTITATFRCQSAGYRDLAITIRRARPRPKTASQKKTKREIGQMCRAGRPPVSAFSAWCLRTATPTRDSGKEVIQPQVPLRLPCYDFAPVTALAFGGLPLSVAAPTSGAHSFHGVTGGVYKARERIHRGVADPRLLAIPASWRRVAASNPN